MGRKQNIWQNIATNAHDGGYKRTALQYKNKLHKKYSFTEDSVNTDNTVSLLNV